EVAYAGEAHAVTVDDGARHHRDLGPPLAVMRRRDEDPPHEHGRKHTCEGAPRRAGARDPERPDREGGKRQRERKSRIGPRQVRVIDGERAPRDHEPEQQREDACADPAYSRSERTTSLSGLHIQASLFGIKLRAWGAERLQLAVNKANSALRD